MSRLSDEGPQDARPSRFGEFRSLGLHKISWKTFLWRLLTFPFVTLYGGWMKGRRTWYQHHPDRRYRAPVPVISVGNISTGGTGKTPLAMWLISHCLDQGFRPAYLSRGYGRRTRGYLRVNPAMSSAETGDEALMVSRRFPDSLVAVCESRKTGMKRLMKEGNPDLIILDDAFQHLRACRDLDLVLLDATRMPDEDHLLPRGRLREPLFTLSVADMLLVNRVESVEAWRALQLRLSPWAKPVLGTQVKAAWIQAPDGQKSNMAQWQGQSVVLFSGLGNNASFHRVATDAGMVVVAHVCFGDHHVYRPRDERRIGDALRAFPTAKLLTTEKDKARLHLQAGSDSFFQSRLFTLYLDLVWLNPPGALTSRIQELVNTSQQAVSQRHDHLNSDLNDGER